MLSSVIQRRGVHRRIREPFEALWKARGANMGRHCQDWRIQGARAIRPGLVLRSRRCVRLCFAQSLR
jgi:hypothetical protein